MKRRHLNESQRGMVAARIATLTHGGDRGNQYTGGKRSIDPLPTQQQAAEAMNVSEATVKRAKTVLINGVPELIEAVERGEIAVSLGIRH